MQHMSLGRPSTPPMTPEIRAHHVHGSDGSEGSLDSRTLSDSYNAPPQEIHLYMPLALSVDGAAMPKYPIEDIDILVAVRNLFSFLVGQSLIATERRSSVFSIFMKISDLLRIYEFSNLDGSTFGEIANTSFDTYVEELGIADCRTSREKTIEAIVLGEKMRSVMLYNEAFVHGVGKWDDISGLGSPKMSLISPVTHNRMGRAAMDLSIREKNVRLKLKEFEFPAIFSGIMNSKTADEAKLVRFDAWRSAFMTTRKFVLSYYKHSYGAWPPSAKSKKNDLETSGLNRSVLKQLYHDFSAWYDLMVDRSSLTTRVAAGPALEEGEGEEPIQRALRRVLDEYDRSTPPVQPPVPFDVPILPSLTMTRSDYGTDPKKDAKARAKKVHSEELAKLLKQSSNPDARSLSLPFLDAFYEFEYKNAKGSNITELCDLRCGQWIFMYAVLESLPMLVVDAPAVKWTDHVEYFLCEPPRSGVPWAKNPDKIQRSWYGVAGTSGAMVSLPSDVIEHGVEGIFRRSHCWTMAEKWSKEAGGFIEAAVSETLHSTDATALPPPPGPRQTLSPSIGSRPTSPAGSDKRRSVLMLGLEQMPLPPGVQPESSPVLKANRAIPSHHLDPTKTFDSILGASAQPPPVKGKKK